MYYVICSSFLIKNLKQNGLIHVKCVKFVCMSVYLSHIWVLNSQFKSSTAYFIVYPLGGNTPAST